MTRRQEEAFAKMEYLHIPSKLDGFRNTGMTALGHAERAKSDKIARMLKGE